MWKKAITEIKTITTIKSITAIIAIKALKAISVLFALVLAGCSAGPSVGSTAGPDVTYAHTVPINVGGENRYKAVRITPSIQNASNSNLSDLLIKDSEGENVPYFINEKTEDSFIENLEPVFTVGSEDRKTNISIEGLKHLRLLDVTIHTDSMFKRTARTQYGVSKEIFNLSINGATDSDTTIPLNMYISRDETYVITISDGDDKPIDVSGVEVRYYACDVVFEADASGAYTLEFGGGPVNTAPVYDIARYKDEILKGPIDEVSIGDISYAAIKITPERDYKLIFNLAIVAVTLLLGVLIIAKLRK